MFLIAVDVEDDLVRDIEFLCVDVKVCDVIIDAMVFFGGFVDVRC